MMKAFAVPLFAVILTFSACVTAPQPEDSNTGGKEEEVYIPKNLNDCFVQLKKLLKPEDIEKMKSGTEDDMIQYHFGLGMGIRNSWGLWGGSRLAKWFNAQGIKHPDDMSGIILDSFWRHLNDKPIKLKEQIKYYQDYWKKQETIQQSDPGDSEKAADGDPFATPDP
jgi:hypothetical protein